MKYTLSTLFTILTFWAYSQNTIVSAVIQARDCEYIGSFTGNDDDYQDLDSALKSKFRPRETAPSGTTNVTLGGVTNGVWARVMHHLRYDPVACLGNNNEFTRVDAVLRALNNTWLTAALDADAVEFNNRHDGNRVRGRVRIKRE
jgi:hypothetical protein